MTEPQTINDLDGVFEDESETKEVEVEAKAEANENEDEEESKGEKDAEEKSEDKDEAEAKDSAPPAEEEGTVPIAALHDERRKRQELEEQLRAMQKREVPNPEEDPEGFAKVLLEDRINSSRDLLMSFDQYSDYEEKEAHFVKMAQSNPNLGVEMNQSRNPALFAYETAKEDLRVQKLKDPNYEKDLEARIREKLLAELKPQETEKKPKVEVPDLTKTAAQGANSTPVEKLEDLDEIFEDSPL